MWEKRRIGMQLPPVVPCASPCGRLARLPTGILRISFCREAHLAGTVLRMTEQGDAQGENGACAKRDSTLRKRQARRCAGGWCRQAHAHKKKRPMLSVSIGRFPSGERLKYLHPYHLLCRTLPASLSLPPRQRCCLATPCRARRNRLSGGRFSARSRVGT